MKPEALGKVANSKLWNSDKAENFLREALKIKEKSVGKNHPDVARILNRLGSLYIEKMDFQLAEEYFGRALEIRYFDMIL